MGFGTLFFGYFAMFAFSLSQAYFFADIIGALVTIYAFSKLSEYNRYFVRAMIACLAFMILCGINATSLMFRLYDTAGTVDMIVDIAKEAAACVMHIFMFLGTRGISLAADSKKLVNTTNRNFSFTMVYYAASVIVMAIGNKLGDNAQYVSMVVYIYWIVCLVLNLVLIYRCFGILCPADEDENAPPKRSKIELINKFNDKFDEIEKKKDEYRRESMRLAMEEADRRVESKKKKHKHRKKKR